MNKKKIIKYFLLIATLTIIIFFISSKNILLKIINYLPENFVSIIRFVYNNELNSKRINNDYNIKFIPETQYINLDFKKIPLNIFSKNNSAGYYDKLISKNLKTFNIDIWKNYIFIATNEGKIFYKDINSIDDKNINFLEIISNREHYKILDSLIDNDNFYISATNKVSNCEMLSINKAKINLNKLEFKTIFSSNTCNKFVQSGRIQKISNNRILIATAADILLNENEIDLKPQDNLSYWGKILILNENNNSVQIFSKGHRNILGLYADNNIILSTENGPRGGDEINRIIYNKNYGWPIASYGAPYNSGSKTNYKKNHNEYYEPIYSFVPSIGISEIIKLDNNFAKEWEDNFLIGSLNDKHLLRVKFNDSFKKVLYLEKIFINERIRDIKYYNQKKIIFLALENTGSLGIIKNANP
jgi:hypothetical protein